MEKSSVEYIIFIGFSLFYKNLQFSGYVTHLVVQPLSVTYIIIVHSKRC